MVILDRSDGRRAPETLVIKDLILRSIMSMQRRFARRDYPTCLRRGSYLYASDSVTEARSKIGRYLEFYNSSRPHSSLGALTPDQVYCHRPPEALAA